MGSSTVLALYLRARRLQPRDIPADSAAYIAFLREAVREVHTNWEDYEDWQRRRRVDFIVKRLDRMPIDVRKSLDWTLHAAAGALVNELRALLETAKADGLLSYESTFQ
jgi:hypothetical protein